MWSRRTDNSDAAVALFQQPPSPGQVKAAALALLFLATATIAVVLATGAKLLPASILLPLVVGYVIFSVGYFVAFHSVSRFTKAGKIGDLAAALNISAMLIFKHWTPIWTAVSVIAALVAVIGATLLWKEARRGAGRVAP